MEVTKIKAGELFEVNGKIYAIVQPKTASESTNDHGQIIYLFDELKN